MAAAADDDEDEDVEGEVVTAAMEQLDVREEEAGPSELRLEENEEELCILDEAQSCDEQDEPEDDIDPIVEVSDEVKPEAEPDSPPEELVCPLTHELMVDPVILMGSGQTYERAPLERWLATHDTDPMTGAKLARRTPSLAENVLVRSMCRRYSGR